MLKSDFKIQELNEEWISAFLESRNGIFTPIQEQYCQTVFEKKGDFSVKTFLGVSDQEVLSWGSFYLRPIKIGNTIYKTAFACAIGTRPQNQRQGLGRYVWKAAEKTLSQHIDLLMIYTGRSGDGYPFYKSLGYESIHAPVNLTAGKVVIQKIKSRDRVCYTLKLRDFLSQHSFPLSVYQKSYQGYSGFIPREGNLLEEWINISCFHQKEFSGSESYISWQEDSKTKEIEAYCIWSEPMKNVGWRRQSVEVIEIAVSHQEDKDVLLNLLQAPLSFAEAQGACLEYCGSTEHFLTEHLLNLGFENPVEDLCVLGKWFNLKQAFERKIRESGVLFVGGESVQEYSGFLELKTNEWSCRIDVETVQRMLLGRCDVEFEKRYGTLAIYPLAQSHAAIQILKKAFPINSWAFFFTEFI